jgi:hypothetical protein
MRRGFPLFVPAPVYDIRRGHGQRISLSVISLSYIVACDSVDDSLSTPWRSLPCFSCFSCPGPREHSPESTTEMKTSSAVPATPPACWGTCGQHPASARSRRELGPLALAPPSSHGANTALTASSSSWRVKGLASVPWAPNARAAGNRFILFRLAPPEIASIFTWGKCWRTSIIV